MTQGFDIRANGLFHTSLGRQPQDADPTKGQGLKARPIAATVGLSLDGQDAEPSLQRNQRLADALCITCPLHRVLQ